VAAGIVGGFVGLPYRHDNLEAAPLKLAAEHFPLPRSLREQVLERYGQGPSVPDDQALSLEDLLDYLARSDNHQHSPLEAVQVQLDAIGDPAEPTREQRAILEWLGSATLDWESTYPLAQPLAETLLPIKNLAAAFALTDSDFLKPGSHPLHQLLDQIVASAIGWEAQLGRAGQALQQHIEHAVTEALGWFSDRDTDLAAICEEFSRESERDRNRARRMAQRAAETETGRARAAEARQKAARMINDCLAKFPAPASIGEFLKGPWFASAQLVILKFGESSRQWASMSETTRTLLDSIQTAEQVSEERRRYIFEVVTSIPKEIKRWLLSLHHDSDAVDEAVGLIEFTHLRVLRQQPLELENIAPITGVEESAVPESQQNDRLRAMKTGQWFCIDDEDKPEQRVQLSLNLERHQQLLFTNQAGLKVLQLDYPRFMELLTQRKIKRLRQHVSFSICLARAAGIDSVECLKALLQPVGDEPGGPADLPMGAWLGFHDGETPLLAKVAVHDPQRDMYVLVNRQGLKLLEVSRPDLLSLMDQGLVEILETSSSFRKQVSQTLHNRPDRPEEE
jgi:hypothetical protein